MSVASNFRMDGRVALLAGAGRGIGAASALALAEAGADVVVMARTTDQIEDVAAKARDFGVRALPLAVDASDPEAMEAAVARSVGELGRLDCVVSVIGGHVTGRGYLAYGAAKAAVDHAVRLMALDLNPHIRVNAVAPGAILTEALEFVAEQPEIKDAIEAGTPLRRLGVPDDIAAAVLYLASPASSYVTGQILAIDGGLSTVNMEIPFPDVSLG